MEEIVYGAYHLETPELSGTEYDNVLLKAWRLPKIDQTYLQSNQNRDVDGISHRYCCTIYASVWAICDIVWHSSEVYEILLKATIKRALEKKQLGLSSGAYTVNSVITAMEVNNELYTDKKVQYIQTRISTSLFWTLINRNYTFVTTYNSSRSYADDIKDGTLDGVSFSGMLWGHCIRFSNMETLKKTDSKPTQVTMLDNYLVNGEYKRYKVPRTSIAHLVQPHGVYFPNVYTYLKA